MDIELSDDKVRCESCPVRCIIKVGETGSCDRYGNVEGVLTRLDPLVVLRERLAAGGGVVPFLATRLGDIEPESELEMELEFEPESEAVTSGEADPEADSVVSITGIGAGTTYPDYKAAPFIVSQSLPDADVITVVTEGIFSYCGVKVKIDTDKHIGPERAQVFAEGHPVGLVTTAEYGSQMLSLGGVNHLTGGTKHAGLATMRTLLAACNQEPVELTVEGGSSLVLQAGKAPIIDGQPDDVMRVGCGSATVGIFAERWAGLVDEVVVVDDHITGVLSEHQAGAVLGMPRSGIRINGRRSTPGRFFNIAEPGSGWGGTDLDDPISIVREFRSSQAWPGLKLLMTSTTGADSAYFVLNDQLKPVPTEMPAAVAETIDQIRRNCEPAQTSVVFMAGAGGSLRAGVVTEPIELTASIQSGETIVTCGGAPVYLWPGGGITIMVDVLKMPARSFGYVPTPALVAPIEFRMNRDVYARIHGHLDEIVSLEELMSGTETPIEVVDRGHETSPDR